MAKQVINIGASVGDISADPNRTAWTKTKSNFDELYLFADQMSLTQATARNIFNPHCIIQDPTLVGAWMLGGELNAEHYIGADDKLPQITAPAGLTQWTVDSDYPEGGATICSVIGGYDTIVNATGSGTMLANHSMVKYSVEGHNTIIGGSGVVLAGGRSNALNCTNSEVDPSGLYVVLATSRACSSGGSYDAIISSQNSHNDGSQSAIITSNACDISSGATYAFVMGNGCDVTAGAYTLIIGNGCTSSLGTAIIIGTTLTNTHAGVQLIGAEYSSAANFTTHMGFRVVENGDCVAWKQTTARRTTNSVAANPLYTMQLPAGKTSSGLLQIKVTCQQDGSADGDASGNFDVAAFVGTIGYRWDGTNGYLYTDATTSGPTASPVMNLTTVRDNITLAAVPQLRISTGLLRVAVTGHASKTIMHCMELEAISTRVS